MLLTGRRRNPSGKQRRGCIRTTKRRLRRVFNQRNKSTKLMHGDPNFFFKKNKIKNNNYSDRDLEPTPHFESYQNIFFSFLNSSSFQGCTWKRQYPVNTRRKTCFKYKQKKEKKKYIYFITPHSNFHSESLSCQLFLMLKIWKKFKF